jgi:hypothetical protein
MLFTDSVVLDGKPRLTGSGYLVADARVARTGIQLYTGDEMGMPEMSVVRVLRSADEVFSEQSMGTFVYKPMTNDHPSEMVDSKNWKRLSIGFVGDTVARDGTFIRVPLTMMDQSAIDDFKSGKCELSVGYTAQLDWTGGVTEDGEKFDAEQRDIRVNHIALVDRARAGPQARIGDSWPTIPTTKDKDMPEVALRTVTIDGLSISTTDQGAQAVEKLQKQISDAVASHTTAIAARDAEISSLRDAHAKELATRDGEIAGLKANHGKALEAKDGEIAGLKSAHTAAIEAKDGEIAALKAQVPDAAAMDALIADRARVFDAARKILGDKADFAGKTAADVRRMAVVQRLGDAQVKDKSDEYVSAAFDTLTAVAGGAAAADPVRDALRSNTKPATVSDRDAPYLAFVKSLEMAHLPNGGN